MWSTLQQYFENPLVITQFSTSFYSFELLFNLYFLYTFALIEIFKLQVLNPLVLELQELFKEQQIVLVLVEWELLVMEQPIWLAREQVLTQQVLGLKLRLLV